MNKNADITVCVSLPNSDASVIQLKKLALTFDKVIYRPPSIAILSSSLIRAKEDKTFSESSSERKEFNLFRDTHRESSLSLGTTRNNALVEAIECFESSSIAKDISSTRQFDEKSVRLKNALAEAQCSDRKVIEQIHELPKEAKQISFEYKTATVTAESLDGKERIRFKHVLEPKFVSDTHEIISTLFDADAAGAYPVFLDLDQANSLGIRLARFSDGLAHIKAINPETYEAITERAKIGNIAYKFVANVIRDEVLAYKSPEDVMKLRSDIEDKRRTFLSAEIGAVLQQISGKDFNKHSMELEKYINFSLRPRMEKYDEECSRIVRKSWGEFAVNTTKAIKEATTYGTPSAGLSYIAGEILPLPSMWQMFLIGSLVGLTKIAPDYVKSVSDYINSRIEVSSSSLAFLNRVNNG